MKQRYRLYRRSRGNYYAQDNRTGKQESLNTADKQEAGRLVHAKNEAQQAPMLNLQIAKAYLMGSDPSLAGRNWKFVFDEIVATKTGTTGYRWKTAIKDKAFDLIRTMPVMETRSEHLLKVLRTGTVSTNVYLRRAHNFVVDMNWVAGSILPRRQWPKVVFKDKRAITLEEHLRIVEREKNVERRTYYQLLWHLGSSQSDLALLRADDIDWTERSISFSRSKTKVPVVIKFGTEAAQLLATLPRNGVLFPYLSTVEEKDRATEFKQRCAGLKVVGITLHAYRYAWAERAKTCGMEERYAQQALGHSSKAVARAYARKAKLQVPALEDYEKDFAKRKLIPVEFQAGHPGAEESKLPVVDLAHMPQSRSA